MRWWLPALIAASSLVGAPGRARGQNGPVTIEARVVDLAGKPAGGVPVSLVRAHALPEHAERSLTEHLERILATQPSGADGTLSFTLGAEQLVQDASTRYLVRLSFPQLERREVVLAELPPAVPVELSCPDCAPLVIHVPGGEDAMLALRSAPPRHGLPWNEGDPNVQIVRGGSVRFPLVERQALLEYELRLTDGTTTLRGRLSGPRLTEAEAQRRVRPFLNALTLNGRLLDEERRPIANQIVELEAARLASPGPSSRDAHEIVTDASGSFVTAVDEQVPAGATRAVFVRAARGDPVSLAVVGARSLAMTLPVEGPNPRDLGELVLAAPGASLAMELLTDQALGDRYAEAIALRELDAAFARQADVCLQEMARRATRPWRMFLSGELERVRSSDQKVRTPFEVGLELEYLTALRRSHGQPDPLALEIKSARLLTATLPKLPVVRCALKNVDGEAVRIQPVPSSSSGRLARCRIELTTADGREVPPLELPMPGAQRPAAPSAAVPARRLLKPGETIELELALGAYVGSLSPGEYRCRVQYHDAIDIAGDRASGAALAASSTPFTLYVKTPPLSLRKAEREAARDWIRALDVASPAPLVTTPWDAALEFIGAPTTPDDRLFRMGWKVVPVLVEELESADAARRAWILALLHDLTGLADPRAGEMSGAVPDSRLLVDWPTVRGAARRDIGRVTVPLDAARQQALMNRWRELKTWFPVQSGG